MKKAIRATLILLIISLLGFLICCNSDKKINQKAIDLNNQAYKFLRYSDPTPEQIDSAILLLDKATDIDKDYYTAYINKFPFLFYKKDYKRLLETNSQIQRINPDAPIWKAQEGFIYDLMGDSVKAFNIYSIAVSRYDSIIKTDTSIGFDFKFQLLDLLILAGEENRAKLEYENLKSEYPDNIFLDEVEKKSRKAMLKEFFDHLD
jgi:tetratricopeptide (TPR) repeat protein